MALCKSLPRLLASRATACYHVRVIVGTGADRLQSALRQQTRLFSIHEYQSQELLQRYNVPTLTGRVTQTAQETARAVEELGGRCIVSPQILHSSRADRRQSPALVHDAIEAGATAAKILSTAPDDSRSVPVKQIYVSRQIETEEEWSLTMTIDREKYCPVILVAKTMGTGTPKYPQTSQDVASFAFTISKGITPEILSRVSKHLSSPSPASSESLSRILQGLYQIFTERDATSLEITRLARTTDGGFTCLGTAFTFDDAAAGRQEELRALRDAAAKEDTPEEAAAARHGIVYVRMDGDVGCVVNGAGLAMATCDAVALCGGKSANFLDAGGQATRATMLEAFGVVMRDQRVKVVFVNIYGGITDGRMIADSIIGAATELGPLRVPMVVRLQGTNSVEGLQMLDEADLGIHVEADFGQAARKAVQYSKGEL